MGGGGGGHDKTETSVNATLPDSCLRKELTTVSDSARILRRWQSERLLGNRVTRRSAKRVRAFERHCGGTSNASRDGQSDGCISAQASILSGYSPRNVTGKMTVGIVPLLGI